MKKPDRTADRLLRLRKLLALDQKSQSEVAAILGVNAATLSRILNGWHKPSQKTKYRIMQRYGVDENYNPLIASLATDPLLSLSPDPAAIPLSALPPEVRKTVTHYDVIQGPPGVTIYVNPDVPLAQRRMALEMAAEMQRKVKEAKGKE